jgi:hypothetical protein
MANEDINCTQMLDAMCNLPATDLLVSCLNDDSTTVLHAPLFRAMWFNVDLGFAGKWNVQTPGHSRPMQYLLLYIPEAMIIPELIEVYKSYPSICTTDALQTLILPVAPQGPVLKIPINDKASRLLPIMMQAYRFFTRVDISDASIMYNMLCVKKKPCANVSELGMEEYPVADKWDDMLIESQRIVSTYNEEDVNVE